MQYKSLQNNISDEWPYDCYNSLGDIAVINMFITFTITFKRHPVNIYLHNYVTKKSTVKAWHSDLLMKAIVAEHSCHTS